MRKELTPKQRIELLKKLVSDCEEIRGFNQSIIDSYKQQIEQLKEDLKSKRIYVNGNDKSNR